MPKNILKKYVIGVDAGNTKTTVTIYDRTKNSIRTVKGKAGGISGNNINEPIQAIIDTILKTARVPKRYISAIHVGAAGIDDEKTLNKVFRLLKKEFPRIKLSVSNDIVNVLKSGTDTLPAIAIIAGTGTNCYGITATGKTAQTAGVNYILGDEGGGYWIGQHLLRYAVRSSDGRMKKSKIPQLILKHFNLKDIRELPDAVFKLKNHKRDVAALASLLTDKLVKEDALAKKLADHAAYQLALNVTTVAKRLNLRGKNFNVIIAGSILTKHDYILRKFKKLVKEECSHPHFIIPDCPPSVGATTLALENIEEK